MKKKLECIKCGLRFKDREDPDDEGLVHRIMCWNCRFVWQVLGYTIKALPDRINRTIAIDLDDVTIRKKK